MDQITEHEARQHEFPELRGERLRLRVAGPADADALVRHLDDWDVVRMLAPVAWPVRQADLRRFLEGVPERAARGTAYELVILPDAGGPVGVVGVSRVPAGVQLGYWLGRQFWGRGVMTEAAALVLAHFFAREPALRVVSGVFWDNPASLRVQEKLGFVVTGEHMHWCEARRAKLRHIDTELTRERFLEAKT